MDGAIGLPHQAMTELSHSQWKDLAQAGSTCLCNQSGNLQGSSVAFVGEKKCIVYVCIKRKPLGLKMKPTLSAKLSSSSNIH